MMTRAPLTKSILRQAVEAIVLIKLRKQLTADLHAAAKAEYAALRAAEELSGLQ